MGNFKPTFLEALGKEWAFEDGADIIVTVDGMLFFYVASGTVISAQDSKLKVESEGEWVRLRKVVNEGGGAGEARGAARVQGHHLALAPATCQDAPGAWPHRQRPGHKHRGDLKGALQTMLQISLNELSSGPCRRRLRTCRFSLTRRTSSRSSSSAPRPGWSRTSSAPSSDVLTRSGATMMPRSWRGLGACDAVFVEALSNMPVPWAKKGDPPRSSAARSTAAAAAGGQNGHEDELDNPEIGDSADVVDLLEDDDDHDVFSAACNPGPTAEEVAICLHEGGDDCGTAEDEDAQTCPEDVVSFEDIREDLENG